MAFVTLTDYTGDIECVIFPKLYHRTKLLWNNNQVLMAKGTVEEKDRDVVMIVDNAVSLKNYER